MPDVLYGNRDPASSREPGSRQPDGGVEGDQCFCQEFQPQWSWCGHINGDKRLDVGGPDRMWSSPPKEATAALDVPCGRFRRGAAEMSVYDVMAMVLNDGSPLLPRTDGGSPGSNRSGTGMARSPFEEHPIMGDLSTRTSVTCVFSELARFHSPPIRWR